jgi:alpha-beta hydrolase superfamily lysophospholipase
MIMLACAVVDLESLTFPGLSGGWLGVSMGGTLASAAAILGSAADPERPAAVVPCVGTHSAETFVRGVLRQRIAWDSLRASRGAGDRWAQFLFGV